MIKRRYYCPYSFNSVKQRSTIGYLSNSVQGRIQDWALAISSAEGTWDGVRYGPYGDWGALSLGEV